MQRVQVGKYRLLGSIGKGSQATVYRARQEDLERDVAVKIHELASDADPQAHERFVQEARLAASLDHPHILAIHDFGEEAGCVYFVTPLVSGGSLASRMLRAPPSWEESLVFVEQIAAALDHAHERAVVHRDVKPANVLISDDGRALLADFGIAKWLSEGGLRTQDGACYGTPAYMDPERALSEAADGRSDQYSLAVLAYELLGGKRPFQGPTPAAYLFQHMHAPVEFDSAAFRARPAVVAVLRRALAKQRDARFGSCREFAEALRVAVDGHAGERPLDTPPTDTLGTRALPEAPPPLPEDPETDSGALKRGKPGRRIALASAVVALGASIWITTREASSNAVGAVTLEDSSPDAGPTSPASATTDSSTDSSTERPGTQFDDAASDSNATSTTTATNTANTPADSESATPEGPAVSDRPAVPRELDAPGSAAELAPAAPWFDSVLWDGARANVPRLATPLDNDHDLRFVPVEGLGGVWVQDREVSLRLARALGVEDGSERDGALPLCDVNLAIAEDVVTRLNARRPPGAPFAFVLATESEYRKLMELASQRDVGRLDQLENKRPATPPGQFPSSKPDPSARRLAPVAVDAAARHPLGLRGLVGNVRELARADEPDTMRVFGGSERDRLREAIDTNTERSRPATERDEWTGFRIFLRTDKP